MDRVNENGPKAQLYCRSTVCLDLWERPNSQKAVSDFHLAKETGVPSTEAVGMGAVVTRY
jgi:hypothetical protein